MRGRPTELIAAYQHPVGAAPPAHTAAGVADLPKEQRQILATHLFCDTVTAPAAAAGRYPDNQALMTEFCRAGRQEGPMEEARAPTPAPAADAAAASGRGRRQRHPNPDWAARQEAQAGVCSFLEKFRRAYYGGAARRRQLHGDYSTCEPPDLPRTGPIEVTDALYTWSCTVCKEPELVFALYNREDVPTRIIAAARRPLLVGGKRRMQDHYLVEWAETNVRKAHLAL